VDKFSIREIAIFYNPGEKWHLKEVEIIGPLRKRRWWDWDRENVSGCSLCYKIDVDGDLDCIAEPYELRKKKPPKDDANDVVSWDDCIWRPEHETM